MELISPREDEIPHAELCSKVSNDLKKYSCLSGCSEVVLNVGCMKSNGANDKEKT